MSLAVAALRLATLKALDGATSAGGRVFDSCVDPRSLLGAEALPTIVVYTDAGKRRVDGRDLLAGDQIVELCIEMFVAKATRLTHDEGGEDIEVEYPATDAGHENRLRRLAYEIDSILAGSPSPWAEMWRRAVVTFDHEGEWDRGADSKGAARFNYLRLIHRVQPVADPVRGATLPADGFWSGFLDLAAADSELSDLARDWRALITTPDLPAWRQALQELGLTYRELAGIGLAPLLDHQASTASESAALDSTTLDPGAIEIDAG